MGAVTAIPARTGALIRTPVTVDALKQMPSITAATFRLGLAARIPRPFPGGPAAHTAAWQPARGISRVLLLTIARGETATPSDRVVLLQCASPGGTHPRAAEACHHLEPVSGDLADLKVSRRVVCTRRYDPVTVSGSGMWDGHHLWFERTFGNPCELHAYTGAVFNF